MAVDNEIFADINSTPKQAGVERDIFADEKPAARIVEKPVVSVGPKAPPAPLNADVARNAMVRTLAGVGDSVLNTPQNLLNLGKMRIGQWMMDAGIHPDNAPQPTPPPNYLMRAAESSGLIKPNVVPQGAGQKAIDFAMGGATGAMLAPAQTIPGLARNLAVGATSGLAGGATKEVTGSDAAATAAAMLTPALASSAINRGRRVVNEMAASRSANAVRDETLARAKAEGFVVPPAETNPSFMNNRLEGLAGKAAIRADASLRNQRVTDNVAARELGLPANTPITEGVLNDFRNRASAPYREVAQLSPLASNALEELRRTRNQAQAQWRFYERSANPDAQTAAQGLDQRAQMLERVIEKVAVGANRPELVNELREARTAIAKSYNIERSLNLGDATVSAPRIGAALDRGAPLTGGLRTIGQFAQGPGRPFVREQSIVTAPGVSGTEIYGAGVMGGMGNSAFGPAGLLAAGIPLLRGPARNLLLSSTYQNSRFANPNYNPGVTNRVLNATPQFSPQDAALMSLIQATNEQKK